MRIQFHVQFNRTTTEIFVMDKVFLTTLARFEYDAVDKLITSEERWTTPAWMNKFRKKLFKTDKRGNVVMTRFCEKMVQRSVWCPNLTKLAEKEEK